MNTRVLVLGASGMAGHMIAHEFQQDPNYDVLGTCFSQSARCSWPSLDVRDHGALRGFLRESRPDVVINCVGALISESRNNPANAIRLNSVLPHDLSTIARELSFKLVHISTDCVFSGRDGSYDEDSFRDADDIYGRSKALGELTIPPDLTLRTSIIGPEIKVDGSGLLTWFQRQQGCVRGFTRAIWSGVTTLELARCIRAALDADLSGLFHVTNGEPVTKFELLKLFQSSLPSAVTEVVEDDSLVVDKSLKRSSRFDFSVASYRDMITQMAMHPLSKTWSK